MSDEILETELESVAIDVKTYQRKDGSGEGKIYNIGAADQKVYTTFSDTIAKIFEPAGTKRKVKYQVKIQGQYTNLVIVDVADEQGNFNQKSGKSYKGGMKADPAKTASIERQVAAKEAVNMINAKSIKLDQFEEWADRINNWIKGESSGKSENASPD